jgi:hypothetical protein
MGMKYECYFCHHVFPVGEKVEAFERGYAVGFLCPRCGKNIKDNILLSKQRLDDCQKKWLNRIFWLSVPFFASTFFGAEITLNGHEISLSALLLALFIAATLVILIFVPCTRKAGVFVTEPAEKA